MDEEEYKCGFSAGRQWGIKNLRAIKFLLAPQSLTLHRVLDSGDCDSQFSWHWARALYFTLSGCHAPVSDGELSDYCIGMLGVPFSHRDNIRGFIDGAMTLLQRYKV